MRQTLVAILAVFGLFTPCPVSSAERELVLELVINGRATGQVGTFNERDGQLYARPAELRDIGLRLPDSAGKTDDPIPISTLRGIRARLNERKQTLEVQAEDAALLPATLTVGEQRRQGPLTRAGYGVVLNYDLLGTFTDRQNAGGGLFDARAFSPYGVLQSGGLANIAPTSGQQSFVRLDSSYTYADPDSLRRWRVGDAITGMPTWGRAVRLGGVQLQTDFTMQPDLITFPLPTIASSAAVPSTVDVLVNGVRQFGQPVQPGPFQLQTLPVVSGAGEVTLAVTDPLGRQTFVNLPFYSSTTLLKPGLASYSLEAGALRHDFGLLSDNYYTLASNGSARYGLVDWLTLEGHAEGTVSLGLAGGGAMMRVGTFGLLNLAGAASVGHEGTLPGGKPGDPNQGWLASAGFQRQSRNFSFAVQGTLSSSGYRDLATTSGVPAPRRRLNATIGLPLGDYGSLSVAYLYQRAGRSFGTSGANSFPAFAVGGDFSTAIASWSMSLGQGLHLYASGFKNLQPRPGYGALLGLSVYFDGPRISAGVSGSLDNSSLWGGIQASRTAEEPGDYGFIAQDQEGRTAQRFVQGENFSPWGRATGGVDQTGPNTAGRVGFSGAVGWLDGDLLAGEQIQESFAVVRTGDVPDIPVTYENRPAGRTGPNGTLLLSRLRAYDNNRINLDLAGLPADVDVGRSQAFVRLPERSGVVVDFPAQRAAAALIKLVGEGNKPIPLGSVVYHQGAPPAPVGHGGEAYLTGLQETNMAEVQLPDNHRCHVVFKFKPMPGTIPSIGPVRCR